MNLSEHVDRLISCDCTSHMMARRYDDVVLQVSCCTLALLLLHTHRCILHPSFLVDRGPSSYTDHFSLLCINLDSFHVSCLLNLIRPSLKRKASQPVLVDHASASRRACASAGALATVTSVVSTEGTAPKRKAVVGAPASRKDPAHVGDRATATSARRSNAHATAVHHTCALLMPCRGACIAA